MKKVCQRCKVDKDIDEFPPKKRNLDGKSGTCIKCTRYLNQYRYKQRKEAALKKVLNPTDGVPWPISK
jgi:hypothetical protein